MAFKPIALTIPQYDEIKYAGWWLKAYDQGTVDALSMATDAAAATLLVKCLLDSRGFPITSSTGPQFIPFIDGDYDLWLFPTEGEADGDITVNAVQLADNLNADSVNQGGFLSAVLAISTTTTITVTTHKNTFLECTSTIDLDFTAAATLGDGFSVVAKNAGTGLITLDPNGSETINSLASLVLGPGEWATITCDGLSLKATLGSNFGGRWIKGADVASAGALTPGSDGNYFDITGTDAITSIVTRGVTGAIKLHFIGILTLTHHATNLVIPGGANITTVAGDEIELIEYGVGTWRVTNRQTAPVAVILGEVVQVVNVHDGAVATGTTIMVNDNTIPQITEGDEYMTLAITPTNSNNLLRIDALVYLSSTATAPMMAALFKNSDANAISCGQVHHSDATTMVAIPITHWITAGGTSSITFRIRAAGTNTGTTSFNGVASSAQQGGVLSSMMTITEYKA